MSNRSMPNNLLKLNKGQIRMGETIAVLLIFFVLLILAFFFFSSIQAATTKGAISVNLQEQGIKVTQIASYLPELQCSTENIVPTSFNCVDLEKARAASNVVRNLTNRDFYTSTFGYANITLEVINVQTSNNLASTQEITIYDVVKPNYKSASLFPVPVSVLDPKNSTTYFGILKVIVYG